MMRLTEIKRDRRWITLRMEGSITLEDCLLLESEFAAHLTEGMSVRLDCSGITYLGSHGATTLRALQRCGLEVVGLAPFVLDFVEKTSQ